MQSIQLKALVSPQGKVTLDLPLELSNQEVDLVVVFEPVAAMSSTGEKTPAQGWPQGFFEATAGAWQGPPLTREPEGPYEQRDELE